MNAGRFTSAHQGPGHSVIYTTDDHKEFRYFGGNWAWRNNNPGNLRPGKISKKNGEIGKAGGFAVFPDYETGHNALLDSLKITYGNCNLRKLAHGYAPEEENDTENYLNFLKKKTGIRDNRKIKDFTSDEFQRLWNAIEQIEGKNKGKIQVIKQITKVKKNKKGTIVSYFIDEIGWVSKAVGVKLASNCVIDAVVATSRSGNLYLRTRPDIEIVNLDDLG